MTLTKLNYNIMTKFKTRKVRVSRVNESVTNPDGTVTVTKGNVYEERPFRSVENIITYLKNDPEYSTKLRCNLFTNKLEYDGEKLTDRRIDCIICDVTSNLGFFSPTKVRRAIEVLAAEQINPYHPIKNFLDNQRWDGNNRIDTMFIDWFGEEDTPLNRLKASVFMRAAVKRVMEPGWEFNNVILFTNDFKASGYSFCSQLDPDLTFFHKSELKNIKDYAPRFNEHWLCYVNELRGKTKQQQMRNMEIFFRSKDTFIPFYEKQAVTIKRHCVFMGSTYNDSFLKYNSITPDSRYWIIDCSNADDYYIEDNLDDKTVKQLWAEAYYMYKQNPDISKDIKEIDRMIKGCTHKNQNNNK